MMRGLASRIGRSEARRRLRGRGLLKTREGCHLELLWMPFYLVTLELDDGQTCSDSLQVLVDGRGGTAARLIGEVSWRDAPSTLGPPLLSEDEALARARALLQRGLAIERRRRGGAGLQVARRDVELVAYPFWMEIFERRRRRYDVRLLDAVGGRRAGAEAKRSVLAALVDEERSVLEGAPS